MSKLRTDLAHDKIGTLLFRLTVPSIVAQLVNVLYNIVDRIFIGRMANGEMAMAGVGVAFPIIMLITAFAALIGMGGAPLAAIRMGEGNHKEAERVVCNSFIVLVFFGIVLTIVFYLLSEPLLWAFGGSAKTMIYAKPYLLIYLLGTLAVQLSLGMNPFITAQGFAKSAMITVLLGAVLNIILDPIFIFTLHMGVRGAALATILSQLVSALWILKFFRSPKNTLRLWKEYMRPQRKIILSVMGLGFSSFIIQITESLLLICFNSQLLRFGGDLAVGAMTIMCSIMQLIIQPILGLTQGAQPIISYNYGYGDIQRVKKTYHLLLACCLCFTIFMWSMIMLFPTIFVHMFSHKPELVEITVWSMRIYFGGILIFGCQDACQQTFIALGQSKISAFISMFRKLVLLIPMIYLLPRFFENQLFAVLLAEPVADTIAVCTTMTCFLTFYHKKLKTPKQASLNEKAAAK